MNKFINNEKSEHRINNQIRVPKIRLVGDNFDDISAVAGRTLDQGVFYTNQALTWAEQLELDLVEISPKADPPVCKIIDYKKFVYDKKKKESRPKHRRLLLKKSDSVRIPTTTTSNSKPIMPANFWKKAQKSRLMCSSEVELLYLRTGENLFF